jgi:hypothetical protein
VQIKSLKLSLFIQLSATNQRTLKENEVHKRIYGWSENGNDEGSLLAKILQADGGRLVANH